MLAESSRHLVPMLLSSAAEPPPDDGRWAYEVKWDGFRVLARVGPSDLSVWSRRGTDFTAAFPELEPLRKAVGGSDVLLDGELVCFAEQGRTSFARIRRRWTPSARQQAARLSRECPATLVVFDLLHLDGKSLLNQPYEERRRLLAGLRLADRAWLTTDYHVGDGRGLARASRAHHLEGLVAKRLSSHYWPGSRSPHWLKLKNYERDSFVIGGWLANGAGHLEALVVGRRDGEDLKYCGTVEFGFDGERQSIREVLELIKADRSPFVGGGVGTRSFRPVQPRLQVNIRFIGWDGPVLREAIFECISLADPA